nr:MAG TPA: hypothetical protein [Bacteriophage sp.]DAH14121.1 MAG TPA: hypothetical protein [Caudoviricetes sp.]
MYELRMFSYCFYYSYTVFFKDIVCIVYLVFVHVFLFPIECYQSLKEVLFVFIFSMLINVEVLSILYI